MKTVYQFTVPDPFGYTPARLVWHQASDTIEIHAYGRIVARMPFVEFWRQFQLMSEYRARHATPEQWAELEALKVADIERLAGGKHDDVQR